MTPLDWDRVAALVREERLAQRLTKRQAAALCGIGRSAGIYVEGGRGRHRALTLGGVERGLGWPPGTLRRVAEGGEAPATGRHAAPASDADSALVAELAEALRVLARVERRLRQLASRPSG